MSVEEIQKRFAKALRQPLIDHHTLLITPEAEKAALDLLPSPTLEPLSRLEIYAQQYWWRLFNTLHEQYPFVTALFGYEGFNTHIASPYLLKYPPTHWNINFLGQTLPQWLQEEYHQDDRPLVMAAADIDASYTLSFFAKDAPLPTSETEVLHLSPSTFLFSWKWDLIPFRRELLKHPPDHWVENDFPPLNKERTYYTLIRRTPSGNIAADELTHANFLLLEQLQAGTSLAHLRLADPAQKEQINRWLKQRLFTPKRS